MFRCEFASRNLNGCQANQYFTQIERAPAVPGSQLSTGKLIVVQTVQVDQLDIYLFLEAPTEPWKIFIQSREQFSCSGRIKVHLDYLIIFIL